jgi:nickel-dependent lactate racemase
MRVHWGGAEIMSASGRIWREPPDIAEVEQVLRRGLPEEAFRGRKVLAVTPDGTRTCPLPLLVRALGRVLSGPAARLDFMVALGSHPVMGEAEVLRLYGLEADRERLFPRSRLLCHRWDLPGTLTALGVIAAEEVERLTGGLFREPVAVDINRAVFDYDLLILLGPVFPHEVAGYSGGSKYLFPGISGGAFLHFTHWLGAVITCLQTIGRKDTPVRRLLDRAAALLPVPRLGVSAVVAEGGRLAGLYAGSVEQAWSLAADQAAELHVRVVPRAFSTVLGVAPRMYDELWVGGKVMYKLEPVVAEGGRLILYAPHLREVSRTWGELIGQVGYHVRDYFLAQWERFRVLPWAVLAHSTHVKGTGSFQDGVESPRIEVLLATGLPEELCRRLNLGYLDPRGVRLEDYRGREAEGILRVDPAGETLYRQAGPQRA